jgi:predicted GNAT family acetyltransferase
MHTWRLRDFHHDDLDEVISIWDQSRRPDESHPVFSVSEVISAARAGQPAVVAVVGDQVVGMAAAHLQGERAWISMVALGDGWRNQGLGSALLGALEARLHAHGVRRISALLPRDATGAVAERQ